MRPKRFRCCKGRGHWSPPDGKVHIVCFFVGFGKGTGTVWFDDLRLEEVSGGGEITITGRRLQREPISPMIYGNFMELLSDLVPAMWAEKLDGTSFEYLRTPQERELHRSRFTFDPKRDLSAIGDQYFLEHGHASKGGRPHQGSRSPGSHPMTNSGWPYSTA